MQHVARQRSCLADLHFMAKPNGLLFLSTMRPSPHDTPRRPTAPSASRSSISTSITAMARSTSSGRIRPSCTPQRTKCHLSRHGGDRGSAARTIRSSTPPCAPGDGGKAFREAMEIAILPRIEAFSPDVVVISAGFDGHHRNSLANLNLVEADYVWNPTRP